MLRTSSVLTATGLSILLLSGCHKGTGVGPEAQGGGLSALFEHNVENADQTFTVNATTGGVILGTMGCKCYSARVRSATVRVKWFLVQ